MGRAARRPRDGGARLARTAAVLVALLTAAGFGSADAKSGREAGRDAAAQARGTPMLAVVALSEQRVTIYGAEGRLLQSPVSTGATGLETPAGIYSVVQKNLEHHSNIYEDGAMPFMQRITWTGIALHGGVLPGYPASHGCVRMPMAFAQHLYQLTDIGLRILIVRDDVRPIGVSHRLLFKPKPPTGRAATPLPGSPQLLSYLKSAAEAKSLEASAAAKKAAEARAVAARRAAEAAPAAKALHAAEANLARAEEGLQRALRALETAAPEAVVQAGQAKERAEAAVTKAREEATTAKMQGGDKGDAAARASELAATAEVTRVAALDAAEEAAHKTSPISVFISRKTQRLYVRQGYQPVFEGPVLIRDPDQPIGSYVFTALGYSNGGADVRWSLVSMYRDGKHDKPAAAASHHGGGQTGEAAPADVAGALAALDRITIAEDVRARISEVILPGASLIVSDEGAHIETGKDTDFVVLMSGEPQGGIKARHREFLTRPRGDGFFGGGYYGFGLF
jgi:hypothetical protein